MKTNLKNAAAKSTRTKKSAQPNSLLDVICKVLPPQSVQDLYEFVEMRPKMVLQCRNSKTGGLTKRVVLTLKESNVLREQLFNRYEQLSDALEASKQNEARWKKKASIASQCTRANRRIAADKAQPLRHKVSGGLLQGTSPFVLTASLNTAP